MYPGKRFVAQLLCRLTEKCELAKSKTFTEREFETTDILDELGTATKRPQQFGFWPTPNVANQA